MIYLLKWVTFACPQTRIQTFKTAHKAKPEPLSSHCIITVKFCSMVASYLNFGQADILLWAPPRSGTMGVAVQPCHNYDFLPCWATLSPALLTWLTPHQRQLSPGGLVWPVGTSWTDQSSYITTGCQPSHSHSQTVNTDTLCGHPVGSRAIFGVRAE